jgi:purine-binding chemotaxis protein CheW
VERIVSAAAITPLPRAPEIILGILDLQGEIVPVIDMRKRFRLPAREIHPADQFIIARTRSLKVALLVDATRGVLEEAGSGQVARDDFMSGMAYVSGVTRTEDGLVLINDLDEFLSLAEEKRLLKAMEHGEE